MDTKATRYHVNFSLEVINHQQVLPRRSSRYLNSIVQPIGLQGVLLIIVAGEDDAWGRPVKRNKLGPLSGITETDTRSAERLQAPTSHKLSITITRFMCISCPYAAFGATSRPWDLFAPLQFRKLLVLTGLLVSWTARRFACGREYRCCGSAPRHSRRRSDRLYRWSDPVGPFGTPGHCEYKDPRPQSPETQETLERQRAFDELFEELLPVYVRQKQKRKLKIFSATHVRSRRSSRSRRRRTPSTFIPRSCKT